MTLDYFRRLFAPLIRNEFSEQDDLRLHLGLALEEAARAKDAAARGAFLALADDYRKALRQKSRPSS